MGMSKNLRREFGLPTYELIIAGRFRQREDYATFRRRGTRDWLLVYTVDGAGEFRYADGDSTYPQPLPSAPSPVNGGGLEVLEALPGRLVLVAPSTMHDYRTQAGAGAWELLWTHFLPRPHWPELMLWPEAGPGLMFLDVALDRREALMSLMGDVALRASRRTTLDKQWALVRLEEVLLECSRFNPRSSTRLDERVASAINYMLGRISSPVTLAEIADASRISASRLGALFREQTGETPLQFLERHRIEAAKQSLDLTTRSITDIAQEVGFPDPLYFSLRFKKHTGLSPRHYREREPSPPTPLP